MDLNWDNAKIWQERANEDNDEFSCPQWRFDCNFKLDYDGPLMSVSSRFYPPHYNSHGGWEGTVNVQVLNKEVEYLERKFCTDTLDGLKKQVEAYKDHLSELLQQRFR